MSNNIEYIKDPRNGKAIAGIILLLLGSILLLRQLNPFFVPDWLFSWPLFLIIPGLYIGAKSNFQKPTWFILVLLGAAFMADEALSSFHNSGKIIWPVVFIVFGIWMILRRNNKHDNNRWQKFEDGFNKKSSHFGKPTEPVVDYVVKDADVPPVQEPAASTTTADDEPVAPPKSWRPGYSDDFLDAVAVFGGVDKIIMSKDFKGGDIVNIFGGTEIDFSKADINGRVVVEIVQVFGGTKLIVPPHWHVISDMASIFASVDDKRMRHAHAINNEKVLIVKGVSIFAGVDIRSY